MATKEETKLRKEIESFEAEITALEEQYLNTEIPSVHKALEKSINQCKTKIKRREAKLNGDSVSTVSIKSDVHVIKEPENIFSEVIAKEEIDHVYAQVPKEVSTPIFDPQLEIEFAVKELELPGERKELEKLIGEFDVFLGLDHDIKDLSIVNLRALKKDLKGQLIKKKNMRVELMANFYIGMMSKIGTVGNYAIEPIGYEIVNYKENLMAYKKDIIECIEQEFTNDPAMAAIITKIIGGYAGIAAFTAMATVDSIREKK